MGVVCQRQVLAALPSGKTQHPLYRMLGVSQSWSGQVRNKSSPHKFDPRTTQPVASRYTVWDTPATSVHTYLHSFPNVQQIYGKSQHWWCASHLICSMLILCHHTAPVSNTLHTNVYLNVCNCKYNTYLCVRLQYMFWLARTYIWNLGSWSS